MPFEVTCGQCQGRLLVDAGGVVVECPLCGAHLSIPPWEDATPTVTSEPASVLAKSAVGLPETVGTASQIGSSIVAGSAVGSLSETDQTNVMTSVVHEAESPASYSDVISHSFPNLMREPAPSQVDAGNDQPVEAVPQADTPLTESLEISADESPDVAGFAALTPAPVTTAVELAPSSERVATSTTTTDMVPRQWFVMLASYASAATMVLLYLVYSLLTVPTQQLESLPDLVPQIRKSDGEISLLVPPINAVLPPGHVLKLGDTQRFGSLRVTPLKIVRGRLQFEHVLGTKAGHEPSEPVLKLWLRFDNVSTDQIFPPLDRTLVFKRIFQGVGKPELTNQFVREAGGTQSEDIRFLMYALPENSEFAISGQNLGIDVKPGEAWETFLPLEEITQELDGTCVWRVQFRKGYHPRSGRGVTTLIDIHFNANEIREEQSA